jgi:hypothetical protein
MSDGEEAIIRVYVRAHTDAWTRGNADGLAAKAGDDLGFANILGRRFVGREAFVKIHERILTGTL